MDRASAADWARHVFDAFRTSIRTSISDGTLADGIIGKDLVIDGPFGPKALLYADYAASGRALRQVEDFIFQHVLPVYANPHTQASFCGRMINALRAAARSEIARHCGATGEDAVIFAGSGATAGIQKLVRLFECDQVDGRGEPPLVLLGPYEHHSNLLPWRESGAEVVELPEDPQGGPDRRVLELQLARGGHRKVVCAFSAGSNVTGAMTDVDAVGRHVKSHGALLIWDYAGAASCAPVQMGEAADARADAIIFSPHKFVGGPGASGVLVVRRDAIAIDRPTEAGGGTVSFVSPERHDYLTDVSAREESGTPNVMADIRAALAVIVRSCLEETNADSRAMAMAECALKTWQENSRIAVLGDPDRPRLPIISFQVIDGNQGPVHHQLVTRLLSDRYGIQARGGCACAGPYVHRLLDIDCERSEELRRDIQLGHELDKPGFVRVNFSALMSNQECDYLIESVCELANEIDQFVPRYHGDLKTAVFEPIVSAAS